MLHAALATGSYCRNITGRLDSSTLQDVVSQAAKNAWDNLKALKLERQTELKVKEHEIAVVDFVVNHTVNTFPYENGGVTIAVVYSIKAIFGNRNV